MGNTINGRTPEEIKKGMECCGIGKCSQCPYLQFCDEYIANGGDAAPTEEIFIDSLALAQQLERERDAMHERLARYKKCIDCACYPIVMDTNMTCDGCELGSNWQWRGVQEEA